MRTNEVYVTAFTGEAKNDTDEILKQLAVKYACETGMKLEHRNSDVVREEFKKPYFKDSEVLFSVSHSGNYDIFAFGAFNMGIDIQKHKPCSAEKIARRFFSNEEYEYLKKDDFISFFRIWTAKESYVKYTGQGITNDYEKFSVINKNGEIGMENVCFTEIPFVDGYSMFLCTENEVSVRLFCM